MRYRRTPIEVESPEELGYDAIANNLAESSFRGSDARRSTGSTPTSATCCSSTAITAAVPRLREQLAGARRGPSPSTTCSSPRAPPSALFIVATALLEAGDHVLIAEPNYATNLETPRTLGADVERGRRSRFEDGWQLDLDLRRGAGCGRRRS